MWAAVVKLAIDDIRFGSTKRKKRSQEAIRNYNSAKAWFLREKDRNVGSFLWVCDLLKLNPTLTRNRILLET